MNESRNTIMREMLRITTLVEDERNDGAEVESEHGLSFLIEKDGHSLLFDTGQSGMFLRNAERLGVDLSAVEYVVVSHGHYDHSGGLRALVESNAAGNFRLVVGSGFFEKKYAYKRGKLAANGNDFDEEFLREHGIPYELLEEGKREILPGISLLTDFPRTHDDERINPRFKLKRDGELEDDTFADELLVTVESPRGPIVLLGCSHPGMKNMLDAVEERVGGPIYAVLGGTHLIEASQEAVESSSAYLRRKMVTQVGVSHCTGSTATAQLRAEHAGFFENRTGSVFTLSE